MKLGDGKKETTADVREGWEDEEWEVNIYFTTPKIYHGI